MFQSYDIKQFGDYLKNLRKSLHLTQKDVEELSGISIDTIRRIENGTVIPRYDTLHHLSLAYKKDLMHTLNAYANSNEVLDFYKTIDAIIINYTPEAMKQLKEDYDEFINNEEVVLINNAIKDQLSLVIQGIIQFNEQKISEAKDSFIQAIQLTIPQFKIQHFDHYKYTVFEIRALMMIGLGLLDEPSLELSTEILEYCYTLLNQHYFTTTDEKMLVSKILFNISYNYYRMDDYEASLKYSDLGIRYGNDHYLSYALPALLFRKGAALYKLKSKDYGIYFQQSLNLLEIMGNHHLYTTYEKVILNKYP